MGAIIWLVITSAIGGWVGEYQYDHQLLLGTGIGFIIGLLCWMIVNLGAGSALGSIDDFIDFDGGD